MLEGSCLAEQTSHKTDKNATSEISALQEEPPSSIKRSIKIYAVLSIVLVLLVTWLMSRQHIEAVANFIYNTPKIVKKIREPYQSAIVTLSLFVLQVSFIPLGSSFVVFMSFVQQNYLKSILIQTTAAVSSASLMYYLTHRHLRKWLENTVSIGIQSC